MYGYIHVLHACKTVPLMCPQVYDQGSSQERVYSNSGKHVVLSILQVGGWVRRGGSGDGVGGMAQGGPRGGFYHS